MDNPSLIQEYFKAGDFCQENKDAYLFHKSQFPQDHGFLFTIEVIVGLTMYLIEVRKTVLTAFHAASTRQ